MRRRLVALAPAKINIGLEIIGRRLDGLHEIVSVLQTISLYDRMAWSPDRHGFRYESPPGIDPASDLARRALMAADQRCWRGVLRLQKGIPIAAGLGGGSSDAALALKIAHLDRSDVALAQTAAELGADVPFFVEGGTSLATGTGTDLQPLATTNAWCVVVTPRLAIPNKTRTLYASLAPKDFSDGTAVRQIAEALGAPGAIDTPPPNAFTRHLLAHPQIQAAWSALEQAGAPWVSVSGAGPSLYTLVADYAAAQSIAKRVPAAAGEIFVARTLPRLLPDLAAENIATLLRSPERLR